MGKLVFYGSMGHATLTWEIGEVETVREAERVFQEALEKGGAAFVLDQGLDKARRIETFEPAAAEISIVAPMAGG